MQKRVLAAIRLSVKKDETTSPERQDQAISKKILEIGGVRVGTASDLNVSARKEDPFSRGELGEWLNRRTDEFDVIIWWRMDRAVRSMRDFSMLINWAKEHKKCLLFCEGSASTFVFDFTGVVKKNSLAELLATIVAWAAEVESDNISERVTSAHEYMRARGEWGGGMVPYGFEPIRIADADRGWTMAKCEETWAVLEGVIEQVLKQRSLLSIVKDLNARGVDSPRDWWQKYKGRPKRGYQWSYSGLKNILTSRSLLGESIFDGRQVVDTAGMPVERGTPLVSESRFQEIQSALALRAMQPKTKYEDPNPFLGVAFCARCGSPLYMKQDLQKGRLYSSLNCRSRSGAGPSCKQPAISLTYVKAVIDDIVLVVMGSEEEQERTFIPGDDKSEELVEWKKRVAVLKMEWDSLLLTDQEEYLSRLALYTSKIKEIGESPIRPARYELTGTGRTYEEVWSALDVDGKRTKLINMGVRVFVGRGGSPAAEVASADDPGSHRFRQQYYMAAEDVERSLANIKDGRIKKDFQVWFLQSGDQEFSEVSHA